MISSTRFGKKLNWSKIPKLTKQGTAFGDYRLDQILMHPRTLSPHSAFTLILTNDMTMYQGISGQAASQAAGSLLPFQTALSGALESS